MQLLHSFFALEIKVIIKWFEFIWIMYFLVDKLGCEMFLFSFSLLQFVLFYLWQIWSDEWKVTSDEED
jgi:hypothetical protein